MYKMIHTRFLSRFYFYQYFYNFYYVRLKHHKFNYYLLDINLFIIINLDILYLNNNNNFEKSTQIQTIENVTLN